MDKHTADTLCENYVTAITDGDTATARTLGARLELSEATSTAHLAARHHADTEWVPDEFTDFTALPPGRFDPRVFDQDTYWVDILRLPHRITDPTDFTDGHLTATIAFLEDHGWRWANPDYYLDPDLTVTEWVYTTPLMRALRAEAKKRTGAAA